MNRRRTVTKKMKKTIAIIMAGLIILTFIGVSVSAISIPRQKAMQTTEFGSLDITVKYSSGDPCPEACIEITQVAGGNYQNTIEPEQLDENGHVLVPGVPAGQFKLYAYVPGLGNKILYGTATNDQVFVEEGQTTFVELKLAGGLAQSQQSQQSSPLSR